MKHVLHVAGIALILIHGQIVLAEKAEDPVTIDRKAPVEIEKIEAPFKMPRLKRPVFKKQTFNITRYGAMGDGKTKNTKAFEKAIEACSAAGGGKVLVPEGQWLTGPIHLKSNVNLHFQKGAELHFSDDPRDYLPVVFTRWAGFELYNYSPLIYARDCENIAVTGPGKLFGHGKAWWGWSAQGDRTARIIYDRQVLKDVPSEKRIHGNPEAALRPQFINPVNCSNVLLEGFTIASPGPFWTIHILYCENVIVRGLRLQTHGGPNTDGINLDSTRNALIEYCHIDAGDDCVAIKSGKNEDGWRVGRPTENVVIRHITGLRSHGGIVIGSEMSGDVRNIFAHDCEFKGADRGIRLKSNASRGGVAEKIWYRNIKMERIGREAIRINTHYGSKVADENGKAYPVFRDITIEDVICDGARVAVSMVGTSHKPVENITLKNVSIKANTGMVFEWVHGLKLTNIKSEPSEGKPISFKNCKDVDYGALKKPWSGFGRRRWCLAIAGCLLVLFGILLHRKALRERKRRGYWKTVAFVCVPMLFACCFLAALVEGACRFARPTKEVFTDYRKFDDKLGWSLVPNGNYNVISVPKNFDIHICTNEQGFREDGQAITSAQNADIVLIGDSNAFGFGLTDKETLSHRLHQKMAAQGRDVKVLNAGVPGYGPGQFYLRLASLPPLKTGTIVVVLILPLNDLVNLSCDVDYFYGKPHAVLDDGRLAFLPPKKPANVVPLHFGPAFNDLNRIFKMPEPHESASGFSLAVMEVSRGDRKFGVYTANKNKTMADRRSPEEFISVVQNGIKKHALAFATRYWPEIKQFTKERAALRLQFKAVLAELNKHVRTFDGRLLVVVAEESVYHQAFSIEKAKRIMQFFPEYQLEWGWSKSLVLQCLEEQGIENACMAYPPQGIESMFITNDGHTSAVACERIAARVAKHIVEQRWLK